MDYFICWHCPAYLFGTLTTRPYFHISISKWFSSNGVSWKYFWAQVSVPVQSVKVGQQLLSSPHFLVSSPEVLWRGRFWTYLVTSHRPRLLLICSGWAGGGTKLPEGIAHFFLSIGWILWIQYPSRLTRKWMESFWVKLTSCLFRPCSIDVALSFKWL